MRLAIVNLLQTPYGEPLYRDLSRLPQLAVRLFYLQSRDSLRGWSAMASGCDAVRLRCLTPEPCYSWPLAGALNPGLIPELRRFAPDCLIVHGYSYVSQMQAMLWAKRRGIPYFLRGDSNDQDLETRGPAAALKRRLVSYFGRRAAGVLSVGTANERFWSRHGVPAERHFRSPLAVDNEFFCAQADLVRRRKQAERHRLGLPGGRLLLYAGRFAPEKNLDFLLGGLAGRRSLSLALVGDGPERARLERRIRRQQLPVFVFGFRPYTELPAFYGVADGLILPSLREPWGLVVNEAMACGLPVLLSRRAGCLPDLLEEGSNGWSFDPADSASLDACLAEFAALDEARAREMGRRSARLVARCSYSAALDGIRRAVGSLAAWEPAPQPAGATP